MCAEGLSSGRCRRPPGPRARLDGGAVVQDQQAQTGGQRAPRRPLGCEPRRSCGSVASGKARLRGSGVSAHRMKEVPPLRGRRLRQAPELTVHVLQRMLCHLRQHEEPCVGSRRDRTRGGGPVTSARTGVPIARAVPPRGRQGRRERRRPRGTFSRRYPRHRPVRSRHAGSRPQSWP